MPHYFEHHGLGGAVISVRLLSKSCKMSSHLMLTQFSGGEKLFGNFFGSINCNYEHNSYSREKSEVCRFLRVKPRAQYSILGVYF